jgi:transcriptional regulator with XRE-family HTH domain
MKRDLKYQKAFGEHLRKLREQRNWTQMDLAAISRVSEVQISKLENGEDEIKLQTIKLLSVALGFRPMVLLDFEYDFVLNTDFESKGRGSDKPGTTKRVKALLDGNFFKTPRSVSAVIAKCQEKYDVNLDSASVSGVLRKLVASKMLKRVDSGSRGSYLYIKRI